MRKKFEKTKDIVVHLWKNCLLFSSSTFFRRSVCVSKTCLLWAVSLPHKKPHVKSYLASVKSRQSPSSVQIKIKHSYAPLFDVPRCELALVLLKRRMKSSLSCMHASKLRQVTTLKWKKEALRECSENDNYSNDLRISCSDCAVWPLTKSNQIHMSLWPQSDLICSFVFVSSFTLIFVFVSYFFVFHFTLVFITLGRLWVLFLIMLCFPWNGITKR